VSANRGTSSNFHVREGNALLVHIALSFSCSANTGQFTDTPVSIRPSPRTSPYQRAQQENANRVLHDVSLSICYLTWLRWRKVKSGMGTVTSGMQVSPQLNMQSTTPNATLRSYSHGCLQVDCLSTLHHRSNPSQSQVFGREWYTLCVSPQKNLRRG
jgi:hypothetical protein